MYKLIDYYTSKTIKNGFSTKDEARKYADDYHHQAVLNPGYVHNWLTLIVKC